LDRFHAAQFYMAGALTALCLVLYVWAPADKQELVGAAALTLVGFIVGKASNGFNRTRARQGRDDP
jgi:hypothetical protein